MSDAINLVAIIISILALVVALAALAMVIGMKLSTHKVEWKTLDFEKFDENVSKPEEEDEELLEKAKNLQRKKNKVMDPLEDIAVTSNF